LPFANGTLEKFEKEILNPQLRNFALIAKSTKGIPAISTVTALGLAMNTDECHKYNSFCEFLPLCKDGSLMLPEYMERDKKHEEL
jgi:hypothetical protein